MEKYTIATANKRNASYWKNIKVTFGELIEKLSTPTVTQETQGEYLNLSKAGQDKLKDVGGYVCGYLKDGKRSLETVEYRSLLTLDVDFADVSFIDLINMCFNYNYIIHSTRKHTEEKPRYRLIIPFNRNVKPEEYEAVARYVANQIGIDQFDDSTYQVNRLMYYPSISKGQNFIFEYNTTGEAIDVDKVLNSYDNWKDVSTWPTSSRGNKIIMKEAKKQKDPTEKTGIVGAFCRVYDIDTVINTFLNEEYEKCAVGGRYTYRGGSTYGGAVIYGDGKFLFSNHATDPANNTLCNAFDLVRTHKFKHLDEDLKEGTPTVKFPSYLAMLEFASNDKETKKLLHEERRAAALEDFGDFEDLTEKDEASKEENKDWIAKLKLDKKGDILNTIDNIKIVLQNDPLLKNRFVYDEFKHKIIIKGRTLWNKGKDKEWDDFDDANLRHYLEKVYNLKSRNQIDDAFNTVLGENKFHPIKDYLKSLKWDGVERLERLFIDYLGAEDNPYTRAITRLTLVGAVKRVFKAGCKFDTVLILAGKQGLGKSTLLKKLGKDWFNDSITSFNNKDTYEQLQGSWIIELAELVFMSKSGINEIKQFLTKTEDNFRMAYARRSKSYPRQCILIGTTNSFDFLKDPTGDRRFLPLDTGKTEPTKNAMKDLTTEEVNQIWAEAYHLYTEGVDTFINDEELQRQAEEEQQAHREEHPWQGIIKNYLDTPIPDDWYKKTIAERVIYLRDYTHLLNGDDREKMGNTGNLTLRNKVCALEIWCEVLNGEQIKLTRKDSIIIKNCVLQIGGWEWGDKTAHIDAFYGKQKAFKRKNNP